MLQAVVTVISVDATRATRWESCFKADAATAEATKKRMGQQLCGANGKRCVCVCVCAGGCSCVCVCTAWGHIKGQPQPQPMQPALWHAATLLPASKHRYACLPACLLPAFYCCCPFDLKLTRSVSNIQYTPPPPPNSPLLSLVPQNRCRCNPISNGPKRIYSLRLQHDRSN